MGMFDSQDLGTPWADHFKEGDVFTLENIKVGPTIPTSYGPGTIVFLWINGTKYSIFGSGLVQQAQQMTDGDLPARVKLMSRPTKQAGQHVKLLVPADASNTDDIPF